MRRSAHLLGAQLKEGKRVQRGGEGRELSEEAGQPDNHDAQLTTQDETTTLVTLSSHLCSVSFPFLSQTLETEAGRANGVFYFFASLLFLRARISYC